MKVGQAINLYQEYHKVNSKKTPSTHTGTLFPSSAMSSEEGN
jgi:hypothetical protein